MKIPHSLKKVQYESSGERVTSFSGLKPLLDMASKLGVVAGLREVSVKRRARGIPVEDFILSLVSNFVVGGEALSDLELLRHEGATREYLYDLEVPAATTAGEYLRKFTLGHIKQLESVNAAALLRAEGLLGREDKRITLDLDSSIFETHGYLKEGARYGYTRERGYHPLLCFWSERRVLTGFRLRAGNRNTQLGADSFLRENLSRLPKNKQVYLRGDTGFYSHKLEQVCRERGVEFSFSARMTSKLHAAIHEVPEENWQPYAWEQGAEWAEIRYQPKDFSQSYRMLIKRKTLFEGEQLVLGKYHHYGVLTNRRGNGGSLLKTHFARGGAENYIEEFKNGLGARVTPSQKFNANWAWLTIAQLAYNLVQWFKLLLLPPSVHSYQIKKLRLYWFCVPARFVRTGRKLIANLARPPSVVHEFIRVQKQLHCFA